ncbi:MAG: MerR family transcriptional regulator [Gammaproteobacteria bacterium]|nr:MerR family transcriptional regulator [Gammaproteobacteria bacterium]
MSQSKPIEERLAMDVAVADDLFPIRTLSEKTGVGASTLRAWERRYGLLRPQRTPKGHRLYSDSDEQLVQRILTLMREGHAISAIARRLQAAPAEALPEETEFGQFGVWKEYLAATLRAIEDFSSERLEAVFNDASSLHPLELVTERLIEPTLLELGNRWQRREAGIAEEHFYTAWVRNRLGARFHHAQGQARGARILCAGLPGTRHDVGLLLFALSALNRGYRALFLGGDLPLDQVPLVLERFAARAVVLSARDAIAFEMETELAALAGLLDVPLFLGGPCSDRPLEIFEGAGGVRLGSRITVALRLLGSHLAPLGAASGQGGD